MIGFGDDTGEPFVLYQNESSAGADSPTYYGEVLGFNEEVNVSIGKTFIHKLSNDYLDIFSNNDNAVEILREHTSELQDSEDGSGGIFVPFASIPEDGQICVVTWNGTKYECIAEEMNVEGLPIICLGNTSAFGGNQITEHPFLIGIVMPEYIPLTGGMTAAIVAFDGSTTITISIQGECKKIDLKYLPERTHWKEEGIIDIFHEMHFNKGDQTDSQYVIKEPYTRPLEAGKTYLVTFNGEQYECVAFKATHPGVQDVTFTCIGNGASFFLEDTGEPFCIAVVPLEFALANDGYGLLFDINDVQDITVRVQLDEVVYHKLDYRYLPIPMIGGAVEILPETVLDQMSDSEFCTTTPILEPVISGETYTIIWNGTPYECVASEIDTFGEGIMFPAVGDLGIFETGEPTGTYPFAILFVSDEYVDTIGATVAAISFEEVSGVTLTVKKSGGQIKIDPICLPPYDWNANEDEPGHILNRTHYSIDFDPITYDPKNPSFDIIVEPEIVEGSSAVSFHTKFIKISDRTYPLQLLRSIPHYIVSTDNVKYKILTEDSNMIASDEQENFYSYGGISTLEAVVPYQILVAFKAGTYTDGGYIYKMPSPGIYISINSNIQNFTFRISVEGNEIIHKLDQKFLPDYNWEASEGEEGHILNRTHYEEPVKQILEQTTITSMDGSPISVPMELIEGKEYTVIVNGVEYNCVAKPTEIPEGVPEEYKIIFENSIQLKNEVIEIIEFNKPFNGAYGIATHLNYAELSEDPVFEIRTKYTLKKLDPKFLPEISSVEVDTTLSVEGMAADAKAVGDAIGNITEITSDRINEICGATIQMAEEVRY